MSVIYEALKVAGNGKEERMPSSKKGGGKSGVIWALVFLIFALLLLVLLLQEKRDHAQTRVQLEAKTAELAEKEDALAKLATEKKDSEDMLNTHIATLDETIKDLSEKLAAATKERDSSKDELQAKDDKIAGLEADKKALDYQVFKKNASMKELSGEIAVLSREKSGLTHTLRKMTEEKAAQEKMAEEKIEEPKGEVKS